MAKTRKHAMVLLAGWIMVMIIIAVRFIAGNFIFTYVKEWIF